ncbi:hypothetical protein TSUD_91990 [Trifolium subterraneum]|uniref:RNase H type-1 domain-containing protein n=1 Tax=Trifolium subterraneum TaxID=3900 RepID=A0A2Z6PET2_TRISU|nr:hypothetical protein TSUD_91990 [Trifolium subterraneum]
MSHAAKEDLSRILGVRLVLGTSIYLGLPSMVGRSKKAIFSYIKDRIWKKINSWRGRALSKAGKEVMIKSVLQAIPAYVMTFNKAMVAKQVWNIVQNPDSLVAKWRIGSGDNIRVMHDPWLRGSADRWVSSPQPAGDVAKRILETPLVSSVREDKVVWEEERNGCYSVKSGGCLPTRYRLLERRVECNLNCPVCDEEIEDELHIFFRCVVARDSWCAAGLSSVLHNAAYQQSNARGPIFVMPRQIGRYAFDAWNDRYSVHKLQSNSVSGTTEADLVRWGKPALGWWSIHGWYDIWQQTVMSPVEGEAWALLLAMEEARHRGLDRVQFESDSKVLIEAIYTKRRGNSEFLSIVYDILSFMSSFLYFEVKFVRRQANSVAHTLVRAVNS